jgi:hypothetical protein
MGRSTYPAAAIPANLNKLSPSELAGLTRGVLLAILQDRHRGNEDKLLAVALVFQQMLSDAIVVQSDNFETLTETKWSFNQVEQSRRLLLSTLEFLPEGLPDEPTF